MQEAVKPWVFAWVLDVLEGLLGVALLRSLPSMSLLLLLFFFIAIHDALHFLRPQMSKQQVQSAVQGYRRQTAAKR